MVLVISDSRYTLDLPESSIIPGYAKRSAYRITAYTRTTKRVSTHPQHRHPAIQSNMPTKKPTITKAMVENRYASAEVINSPSNTRARHPARQSTTESTAATMHANIPAGWFQRKLLMTLHLCDCRLSLPAIQETIILKIMNRVQDCQL